MPNRPAPISDLARMYRERIPTAPKSIGRLGPVSIGGGGLSLNPMPAIKSTLRFLRNQPGTQVSTPINVGGGVVSMGGQGSASQLMFDPAAQAVERAVGDFTAIPGVGKPSPSYTAEQIRQQGVVPGVLGAAMDYSMFVPGVIKAGRMARSATADAAERLAQSMASREAGIPASALPDRPTIFMRPRIYDPNPPRINSPLEQIGPASDNSYAVGGRGGSVSFVDDQGVSTLGPAPRSGTTPDWMSTPPSERFNPTQALSPEELANLQSLQRPQAVQSQFNRAYQGTSSLPEPNPLSYNLDWSTHPSYDDVDLTRIFNNDLEASMVSPVAADKYVAQQQFRQAAVDYIRNNRVTSNLSYAIIPENYVRLNTINDLLIKHPDLQDIYVTIMQQRGM